MRLPLTGYPSQVLGKLKKVVKIISDLKIIETFYIGRTNNLQSTKSRHGCDDICAIYKTESSEHSLDIEDYLIKAYYNHPKIDNDMTHSGGNISDEYVIYVYIAIWKKKLDRDTV